jgi:hypothetical protein
MSSEKEKEIACVQAVSFFIRPIKPGLDKNAQFGINQNRTWYSF